MGLRKRPRPDDLKEGVTFDGVIGRMKAGWVLEKGDTIFYEVLTTRQQSSNANNSRKSEVLISLGSFLHQGSVRLSFVTYVYQAHNWSGDPYYPSGVIRIKKLDGTYSNIFTIPCNVTTANKDNSYTLDINVNEGDTIEFFTTTSYEGSASSAVAVVAIKNHIIKVKENPPKVW